MCQICVAAGVKSFSSELFKPKQSSFVTHSQIIFFSRGSTVAVVSSLATLCFSCVQIHKKWQYYTIFGSDFSWNDGIGLKRSRHGGIVLGYFRFLLSGLLIRTSQFKDTALSSGRSLWTTFLTVQVIALSERAHGRPASSFFNTMAPNRRTTTTSPKCQ